MNTAQHISLFVIDDDPIANMISTKIIQMYSSFNVHSFTRATDALDQLKKWADSCKASEFPKIIFLDINMPTLDGWGFLEEFQKLPDTLQNNCSVIMLSSSIDRHDVERSKMYKSVHHFLSKPLTSEKLLALIGEQRHFN